MFFKFKKNSEQIVHSDSNRKKSQFLIDLVNNNINLSDALFRLKIILNDLNSKDISDWIDNEINGYDSNDILPEYRKYEGQIFGNLQQGYNIYKNINIPIKEQCKKIRMVNLKENITSIEDFLKVDESKSEQTIFPLDLNMINYATSLNIGDFSQIIEAHILIPKTVFSKIINNIKNTIINIIINLEKTYGYENIDNLSLPITNNKKEIEKIKNIIFIGKNTKIKNSVIGDNNEN